MSHFSVLVIGENVEEQLAPYHEFECTGVNDQYVKDVEQDLEELRSKYLKSTECEEQSETFEEYISGYYEYEVVPFGQAPDIEGTHKYGYTLVDAVGKAIKIINRTNPNKKWDWWAIGGRWSGKLKLKPEFLDGLSTNLETGGSPAPKCWVDSALIHQIDFGGMQKERISKNEKTWDEIDWDQVNTFTEKEKEYELKMVGIKPTDTRESFISRNAKFSTYAVVMDGEWLARGEMGWFGLSDEKLSEDEWDKKFDELLSSLGPNTRITVVDCHI